MESMFESEVKLRVRYAETDKMGYCYYGNYAQYFEIGRVEALRELGISYKQLEEDGVMLPVSDFQVKYISPAFYDDELTVKTKITSLKGVRIYFDYEILNQEGILLCTASTILVFVDVNTRKPTPIPESVKIVFETKKSSHN